MYSLDYNVRCHAHLILASGGTEIICVDHGEMRGKSSSDDSDGEVCMTVKRVEIESSAFRTKRFDGDEDWNQNTRQSKSWLQERNFRGSCVVPRYDHFLARHIPCRKKGTLCLSGRGL